MSTVRVRYQTYEIGDLDIHVRTLRDTQQYDDSDGEAERLGVPSALWPVFGVVWPAGQVLAHLMLDYDVAGLRVLEVGCGIGMASLVLNERDADITATDYHPEAGRFLKRNAALNGGAEIPFMRADWDGEDPGLGRYDLIIGSDILYEGHEVEALANFIDLHANPTCEVVIIDPGRGQRGRFSTKMQARGYTHTRQASAPLDQPGAPFTPQVLSYLRTAATPMAS